MKSSCLHATPTATRGQPLDSRYLLTEYSVSIESTVVFVFVMTSSPDNRRDRILAAAARCIARAGIRGLRMSDVGREAGVSSGLLYYHFADRSGLLAATLAHVNDTAAVSARPGVGGRRALIDNLVAEITDTAEIRAHATAWHEIGASAVFDADTAAHLAATDADWQARIAAHLQACGLPADEAARIALAAVALVDGLISRWLSQRVCIEQARMTLRAALDALIPH